MLNFIKRMSFGFWIGASLPILFNVHLTNWQWWAFVIPAATFSVISANAWNEWRRNRDV